LANWLIVQSLLEAVKEGSKAYHTWLKSRDKKRLELCKDAGEKYIFANEKEGEFKNFTDKQKEKYLKHYRRRFFTYN
jgi:TRAP-type C4-dicarboxylate transport system substrate-binding protein